MTFTKPRDLLAAGLFAAVAVYLLVRLLYGQLPPLPTFAGASLFVLAVAEGLLGRALRGRIQGTHAAGKPLHPLSAARALALAKASSLLGAIMLGAWIAVLAYVLPQSGEISAAADDIPSAVVGAVSAALLIGAALWLENCCRTPEDRDDQRQRGRGVIG